MKTKASHWCLTPLHLAVVVAFGLNVSAVRADESPYTIGVLETIEHDSNVFHAGNGADAPSDWFSVTGVTGTFDQSIGRSSVKAAGEFDVTRFERNKNLNNVSHNVGLDGTWSTIGRLSGEYGISNSVQLYRYNPSTTVNIIASEQKNTQTLNQANVGLHLGVVTPLTFDLTGNAYEQKYSLLQYQSLNFHRYDLGLGATYRSNPNLRFSLSARHTNGEYPTYGDHFGRNDVLFGLLYVPTGLTQFTMQVGFGRDHHSLATSASSRNWNGNAQWIWQATGRTQFRLQAEHGDDTSNTPVTPVVQTSINDQAFRHTTAGAAVYYDVTGKIQAHLTAGLTHRNLDTVLAAGPNPQERGTDNSYNASFGLDYSPTRMSKIGCNAAEEKRTTSGSTAGLTFPFKDTVFSCTAQIAFN